jgi:hypothetical protein
MRSVRLFRVSGNHIPKRNKTSLGPEGVYLSLVEKKLRRDSHQLEALAHLQHLYNQIIIFDSEICSSANLTSDTNVSDSYVISYLYELNNSSENI